MQEKKFDPLGLIKQILIVLAISVIVFVWCMLVLLTISFVALSYITIKLKWMIIVSAIVTICVDSAYLISKALKKKK